MAPSTGLGSDPLVLEVLLMLPREHLLVLEVLLVLLPRLLCIRRSCCEADRKRCGECNGNPMRLHERDATRSKRSVIESRDTSGVPSIDSFSFANRAERRSKILAECEPFTLFIHHGPLHL